MKSFDCENVSETVKEWFKNFIGSKDVITIEDVNDEIKETQATRSNEHLWELACAGEYNPHTENILDIYDYISLLELYKKTMN